MTCCDIIRLRKITRYLCKEANGYLTDAQNTLDDHILHNILTQQESDDSIDVDDKKNPPETLNVNTMNRCSCCNENKDDTKQQRTNNNKSIGGFRRDPNFNILPKCTCPPKPQTSSRNFRKVLASNKTYNYASKLPESKPSDSKNVQCHCIRGNRCYCCFDSTDTEEAVLQNGFDKNMITQSSQENRKKDNIVADKFRGDSVNKNGRFESDNGRFQSDRNGRMESDRNGRMQSDRNGRMESDRNDKFESNKNYTNGQKTSGRERSCECECNSGENSGRHNGKTRGKSVCRDDCRCSKHHKSDQYLLYVKDGKKDSPTKGKSSTRNERNVEYDDVNIEQRRDSRPSERFNRINSNRDKTTDAETSYRSLPKGRTQIRSNSEDSIPSRRQPISSDEISAKDLEELNKFRDKFYFECHAIPKEQFYRRNKEALLKESQRLPESNENRKKSCRCACKDRNRPQHSDERHVEDYRSSSDRYLCCLCCDSSPKNQYRLEDYRSKNNNVYASEDDLNRSKTYQQKSSTKDCQPNYTINIPEICFKFPINGGKIIIENQNDDLNTPRVKKGSNTDSRRHRDEQDYPSMSLRHEQGFECP